MVTREQIKLALDDDKDSFKTKNIDHDVVAITLLRSKIPYDVCKNIIGGATYEQVFLVDVEKAIPYLTAEDLTVLADCNCAINEDNDMIYLFV